MALEVIFVIGVKHDYHVTDNSSWLVLTCGSTLVIPQNKFRGEVRLILIFLF